MPIAIWVALPDIDLLPAVHCWVSTWMRDRLWAGKLSQYVTGHIGQLSLPSHRDR